MEKLITIKLENDVIDQFEFDFADDETDEDIRQAVMEYVYGNLTIDID